MQLTIRPPWPPSMGRALDRRAARGPSMGWPRSPYLTAHIALYGSPLQHTAQEGEGGGLFPGYPVSPSLASFSAMDRSMSAVLRSVLSSISICSVNRPAVFPSSSLALTLTLSAVALSASFSKR